MKVNALVLKTVSLFLLWLLLSETFGWRHVTMGLFAAFGVAWFNTSRSSPRRAIPTLRTVWYYIWLAGRILQSGFHLSKLILHPSLPIDPKMIRHRTELREGAGIVLLGNSITLTPGTITVEVSSDELTVHAMDDAAAEDLKSLRFDKRIAGLVMEGATE